MVNANSHNIYFSWLISLIVTVNVFALYFLKHGFFLRDLTFFSPKMVISHRKTEADIRYPPRSKHMWHTEKILTVHLIFSLREAFPGGLDHKKKSIQKCMFFVWHLSPCSVCFYIKDGFLSHRPKSRASKDIRMISIYYNDSYFYFLLPPRYLLVTFLLQQQSS